MKPIAEAFIVIISLLLFGCNRSRETFFQPGNQNKIIALQPLDDYDTKQLDFISKEIENFYTVRVIILKPAKLPETFRLAKEANLYSADSILDMLSTKLDDEVIEIVGVTHKDIYILKKEKNITNNTLFDNSVQPIFGFADFAGNCAVVTDAMFKSSDIMVFQHRLRTSVIHEIGHNIGLDHCQYERCIMSEQNGKLFALDKSERDYCNYCRKKLKKINPAYRWSR